VGPMMASRRARARREASLFALLSLLEGPPLSSCAPLGVPLRTPPRRGDERSVSSSGFLALVPPPLTECCAAECEAGPAASVENMGESCELLPGYSGVLLRCSDVRPPMKEEALGRLAGRAAMSDGTKLSEAAVGWEPRGGTPTAGDSSTGLLSLKELLLPPNPDAMSAVKEDAGAEGRAPNAMLPPL
jgi:hypothetical protein